MTQNTAGTSDDLTPLILDMLEWIAKASRTYDDVMEAWRTSCPRLTVWEESTERGFVGRQRHHDNSIAVQVTAAGLAYLARHGRQVTPHTMPPEDASPAIGGWHAHVYFDAGTVEKATALCRRCALTFGILMGRVHQRPVGPHPDWSCQLTVPADRFAEVVPWLAVNRDGLNILVHPETGNSLHDHRDHAIWLGAVRPLNFGQFMNRAAE